MSATSRSVVTVDRSTPRSVISGRLRPHPRWSKRNARNRDGSKYPRAAGLLPLHGPPRKNTAGIPARGPDRLPIQPMSVTDLEPAPVVRLDRRNIGGHAQSMAAVLLDNCSKPVSAASPMPSRRNESPTPAYDLGVVTAARITHGTFRFDSVSASAIADSERDKRRSPSPTLLVPTH
jgi:hypothetical protein